MSIISGLAIAIVFRNAAIQTERKTCNLKIFLNGDSDKKYHFVRISDLPIRKLVGHCTHFCFRWIIKFHKLVNIIENILKKFVRIT